MSHACGRACFNATKHILARAHRDRKFGKHTRSQAKLPPGRPRRLQWGSQTEEGLMKMIIPAGPAAVQSKSLWGMQSTITNH
jgi:hypothetical protein